MRRIVSVFLVMVLVLSLTSTAFGTTYGEDVYGEPITTEEHSISENDAALVAGATLNSSVMAEDILRNGTTLEKIVKLYNAENKVIAWGRLHEEKSISVIYSVCGIDRFDISIHNKHGLHC